MPATLLLSRRPTIRLVTALAVVWWGSLAVPPARAGAAVLVGAGDIAECRSSGDAATAALVGAIPGTVFTLGDNAYDSGTTKQFNKCYGPTWGRFKGRTRPAIGNHEYETSGADGYFDYFGKAAGPRGKGWYSYNTGTWHVIVLNANCDKVRCDRGSEQERWLRADLAAHTHKGTLAYWHQARFVSDKVHGNHPELGRFWEALYDYGAELVLSGHSHVYERRSPDPFREGRPRPRDPPDRCRYGREQPLPVRTRPAEQPGARRQHFRCPEAHPRRRQLRMDVHTPGGQDLPGLRARFVPWAAVTQPFPSRRQ